MYTKRFSITKKVDIVHVEDNVIPVKSSELCPGKILKKIGEYI